MMVMRVSEIMPRKITGQRYPDARVKGMMDIFDLIKEEHDWRPNPIDKTTLQTLDIARGKETNALFALKFLGLIDDTGSPTSKYDDLSKDFDRTLAILIRDVYSKLFDTIPASRISRDTLVRFFMAQGYSEETAEYQGKLFVELCSRGGISLPSAESSFSRSRFQD